MLYYSSSSHVHCCSCSGQTPYLTADDFEKHLTELLEEIHNNIPRVFVNYILLFNISLVPAS